MIASESEGVFGSGGVMTLMYARKLAKARIRLSKCRYASASAPLPGRSSSAVRSAAPQNVMPRPSSWGANMRTSGAIVCSPRASSLRSLITELRSRPTVWISPGAVNPGATSVLRRIPPTASARSSSTTFRPALAR